MSRDPQSKEPLSRPRVDRLIRCAGTRGYCEIERKLRRNRGFLATTVAYDIERVPKFPHVELHAFSSISRTSCKTARLVRLRQPIASD